MPSGSLLMLDAPKAGRLNIQYAPDADTVVAENPPRFTWLPVIETEAQYVVRISSTSDFSSDVQTFSGLNLNFFTPDRVFAAGEYFWSYAVWSASTNAAVTEWSAARAFTIDADLPETPLA
jgi:hypothetical protein